jgi:UDP-N-acetylmuramoyl-tripeptide--D-alanyl-D-alanine ligase
MGRAGFMSAAQLAAAVGGRWVACPAAGMGEALPGVSTDTRTMEPGEAFIAIRGERFDAHDHLDNAADAGAAFAVVSQPVERPPLRLLHVPDTRTALQQLATAWRDRLAHGGVRVICVSGSNGKTTTRQLIHHVLTTPGQGDPLRGTQSPKSFNNHIGVPLTLLAARPGDDFVAVEIGTNHHGETAALADIARPDIAVVTSIGREHLEHLGNLDGVAREQAALLPRVRPGGVIFTTRDAGTALAPYYDVQDRVGLMPVPEADPAVPADLPTPGEHHRSNARLAAAVARYLGRPDAVITAALRSAPPVDGRMQRIDLGPVTVLHDAYNANPDSAAAALRVLVDWPEPGRRKVAVLGDMLELGSHTEFEHAALAAAARNITDELVLIGEHFPQTTPWHDDLPRQIATTLRPGDVILLKASRGVGLERLIPPIRQRFCT